MKRLLLLFAFLLLQLTITVGVATSIAYGIGHDKAPSWLSVKGIRLSSLTESEAILKLNKLFPKEVAFKDKVFPLKTEKSREALQKWLHEQYSDNHDSKIANAINFLRKQVRPQSKQEEILIRNEIIPQLKIIKQKIDSSPQPAKITFEDGKLIKKNGSQGYKLDIEESFQKLLETNGQSIVQLEVKEEKPNPNNEDIAKIRNILGDYTTYFNPADEARTNNVRLAAQALDGKLIPPGEELSFNNTVGERTEDDGYRPAFIIVNKKITIGDGGGVCQDSSTLYQAVQQANLDILERHTHSLPVYYVPKGHDATVAFGQLDFKFKNDTKGYLLISARTGRNWLRIQLFGMADEIHPSVIRPKGYPVQPEELLKDPK